MQFVGPSSLLRVCFPFLRIYDQLILTMPTKATTPPIYKGAVMSGLGCQSDEAARVAVKRH